MDWSAYLKSLYPDSHNVEGPIYSAILGAIGAALELTDPNNGQWDGLSPGNLAQEFSVTMATTDALDRNGQDWGIPRRAGESDSAYRARILAALALYASGASVAGLTIALTAFTGTAPVIVDNSADGWVMGTSFPASTMGQSAMGGPAWYFSLSIYVQNPGSVSYSHFDFESTVKVGLPARASARIFHDGVDTSVLAEDADAVVTVTG